MDFAKKTDLANLKPDVDIFDIDIQKNAPSNLISLKNKLDKLDVYRLVPIPVDLSNLSDVVKKCFKKDAHNAKITDIEGKISDITNLATNTTLNIKINGVKNEIPGISNLFNTTAPTAGENKVHDHNNYITTSQFNKLTAKHFAARLAQANLVSENDIVNFVKKTQILTTNKKIEIKKFPQIKQTCTFWK